ncbi:transposase [candidate division LCP-89 bacterium B3_LCP]|uniref:Transposase n=1 Tax=candidate division LCP-89 bacterium B3_LCP TaxID=2012998 RepID=A0A532V3G6_UNCL8|nr:MAG: transposase [candidate division LCP-89 bacterium B3_LCP]
MISPGIKTFVEDVIKNLCKSNGYKIIALNILEEHVHLFVEFKSSHKIGELVKYIKGRSSRLVNLKFGETLKWQKGYGANTVGLKSLEIAKQYVLNQAQHHQD